MTFQKPITDQNSKPAPWTLDTALLTNNSIHEQRDTGPKETSQGEATWWTSKLDNLFDPWHTTVMFMEATSAKQNTFKVTWVPGSSMLWTQSAPNAQPGCISALEEKGTEEDRMQQWKGQKIVGYRFLGNASFVFIDLYIVLCSPSFLHSLFLPFPMTAMLPIYSEDLVFFSFVCRSTYVSLRVLFVV